MRRAMVLWEVFVLRLEQALDGYKGRRVSADEAGELPDISGRHFRRLSARCAEEGVQGLRDPARQALPRRGGRKRPNRRACE